MCFVKVGLPAPSIGKIKVTNNSGSNNWYSSCVGKIFDVEFIDSYGYWVREGGIYNAINWVKLIDAVKI